MEYDFLPERHQETRQILASHWPHLFSFPVPLKVGIHWDILETNPRPVAHSRLSGFLYCWTHNPQYIAAVDASSSRWDLDGSMCPKDSPRRKGA